MLSFPAASPGALQAHHPLIGLSATCAFLEMVAVF
jgi:hypothetical protein